MPMRVQNHEKNTTVFAKMVDGNLVRIVFKPEGVDGDIQRVPDSFADDIDFLNAIDQGVISVVDGPPAIIEKINAEKSRSAVDRQESQARQQAAVEATMDRSADNSMLGFECIAPKDGRPDLRCSETVVMKRTEVNDKPPLCPKHIMQADTFYLVEQGSKGYEASGASETSAGVIRREWKQAAMNPVARVGS